MTNINDIILNFHKSYYNFFEWNNNDTIYHIKKIPLIKVSDKDYLNLKYKQITLQKEFLNKFKNKTLFYNNYNIITKNIMFLVSNKKESMGLMFNEQGKLLNRSGLLFDESEEIEEIASNIDETKISYQEIKKTKQNKYSRIKQKRKKYILSYINNITDKNVFKYLNYDIYEKEQENYKIIKNKLLKENNNFLLDKLYKTIRLLNKQEN